MKNEAIQVKIVEGNGRFRIINNSGSEVASYSRRRDAVRAAKRKGFEVA